MKKITSKTLPICFVALAVILVSGCISRPASDSIRYFVLSPTSTNENSAAQIESPEIAVSMVKMPSYLLRNSIAVRNGDHEIKYMESARWAERLDENFKRLLTSDLSQPVFQGSFRSKEGKHPQKLKLVV